ncbi:MAG TPA: lysophospholipid acyltransferase family protein, partial [Gemmatales bacterium]|nr:lysophospholipid acyltransferase family protein [Gemmatales bacterium]
MYIFVPSLGGWDGYDKLNFMKVHRHMPKETKLPAISATIAPWFLWYVRKYQVGKFFHATRILKDSRPVNLEPEEPLVVYLNHPSWWDPLVCVVASEFFPKRRHYAPMDATMLKKYAIFSKLGFFGIEPDARGALQFLRMGELVLKTPGSMLWLTAQGEFKDARVRPPGLKNGLGALLARMEQATVVPLALEYPFWNEKKPEAHLAFGKPLRVQDSPRLDSDEWTKLLENALENTQNRLADAVCTRDPSRY